MKPTTLIFPITSEVHTRITRAWETLRQQAKEKGITLARDGAFSGRATGRVTVDRERISVLITDKPWFVPLASVEAELRRLFS